MIYSFTAEQVQAALAAGTYDAQALAVGSVFFGSRLSADKWIAKNGEFSLYDYRVLSAVYSVAYHHVIDKLKIRISPDGTITEIATR